MYSLKIYYTLNLMKYFQQRVIWKILIRYRAFLFSPLLFFFFIIMNWSVINININLLMYEYYFFCLKFASWCLSVTGRDIVHLAQPIILKNTKYYKAYIIYIYDFYLLIIVTLSTYVTALLKAIDRLAHLSRLQHARRNTNAQVCRARLNVRWRSVVGFLANINGRLLRTLRKCVSLFCVLANAEYILLYVII